MSRDYMPASEAIKASIDLLIMAGSEVDAGHWQGYDTTGHPDLVTREFINLGFSCEIPASVTEMQVQCQPNLPWAEEEFLERVGGVPRNPHRSLTQWPWWREQTDSTMYEGMFTHTYSERFWPKHAGDSIRYHREINKGDGWVRAGIRYQYGDLDDVLALLREHPHTRQATFPIFFPEDTGATHGGRIPCTLHYHFLHRDDKLHLWYPIRSCDAVRHFRDDLYMAMRLVRWVLDELGWERVKPGVLNFTAYSFHVHKGDYHLLRP